MSVSTVLSHEFAGRYIVETNEFGQRESVRFSEGGALVEVARYGSEEWFLSIDTEPTGESRSDRLAAAEAVRAAADLMARLLAG
ncbi:hypothetical protein ACFUTX_06820 [Microbacterium sp. NPDC057407]|uniref:hypothetical protein n=1 Tax=Microbacterium sp. NPDC057407 TaxID=3346120 RepID=UPI003670445F